MVGSRRFKIPVERGAVYIIVEFPSEGIIVQLYRQLHLQELLDREKNMRLNSEEELKNDVRALEVVSEGDRFLLAPVGPVGPMATIKIHVHNVILKLKC